MMKTHWFVVLFCAFLAAAPVRAADSETPSIEAALRAVLAENLRASEVEDVAAVQKTIHTKAPSYAGVASLGEKLFAKFDLKYEILAFHYVGMSGDYAIARSSQRTESKDPASTFKNNEVDCMYVFRQEDGVWKLWTQAVLEVNYLK